MTNIGVTFCVGESMCSCVQCSYGNRVVEGELLTLPSTPWSLKVFLLWPKLWFFVVREKRREHYAWNLIGICCIWGLETADLPIHLLLDLTPALSVWPAPNLRSCQHTFSCSWVKHKWCDFVYNMALHHIVAPQMHIPASVVWLADSSKVIVCLYAKCGSNM